MGNLLRQFGINIQKTAFKLLLIPPTAHLVVNLAPATICLLKFQQKRYPKPLIYCSH
jgi:hypothetical protein